MLDDKTFYTNKINDNKTYKSFCQTVRNDSIEDVQILLARLGAHIPNHPRYQTLQQLFIDRTK